MDDDLWTWFGELTERMLQGFAILLLIMAVLAIPVAIVTVGFIRWWLSPLVLVGALCMYWLGGFIE